MVASFWRWAFITGFAYAASIPLMPRCILYGREVQGRESSACSIIAHSFYGAIVLVLCPFLLDGKSRTRLSDDMFLHLYLG